MLGVPAVCPQIIPVIDRITRPAVREVFLRLEIALQLGVQGLQQLPRPRGYSLGAVDGVEVDDDDRSVAGVGEVDVCGQMRSLPWPYQRLTPAVLIPGGRPGFRDRGAVAGAVESVPVEVIEQNFGIVVAPAPIRELPVGVSSDVGGEPGFELAPV